MSRTDAISRTDSPMQSRSDWVSARSKIKTLEELAAMAAAARAAGEKVVLAHGTFDLLHMGHVRHLEAARREGTMLFVTVTSDKFVNKGPGRPVYPELLRAEMLAAIEYVDGVAISQGPSAEPMIEAIRPSIFVKGSDYKNEEDDVTGKITSERKAAEKFGGKLVFTDDITFSSSRLINRYLNVYDPSLQSYLQGMRDDGALERLLDMIAKVENFRVLMVGDAIIDEYSYVTPLGKSAKENMIATKAINSERFAGGIFATANHVASFCKHVEILTVLGEYDGYAELLHQTLKPNIKLTALYRKDSPTTRKTRFVDAYSYRKLFEVCALEDRPISEDLESALVREIQRRAKDFDLVVVNDFGHGMLHGAGVEALIAEAPFLAVNAQSNSANHGYNLITKYRRVDYACMDDPEARLAVQDKYSEGRIVVGNKLANAIDCATIVVTEGKHGCWSYARGKELVQVPALTNSIVDTVGAGDAFFGITAPFAKVGASAADIGFLGNAAGAIKVGILGHRTSVGKVEFIKFLTALLK